MRQTPNNNLVFLITQDILSIQKDWERLDALAAEQILNGGLSYMEYSFYQTYVWNKFIKDSHRFSFKRSEYVVAMSDGKVELIVPLLTNPIKKHLKISTGRGRIAGIINIVCPRHDEYGHSVALAAIQFMREHYKGWKFHFNDVPVNSVFADVLTSMGYLNSERGSYHIPLESFSNYDNYLSSLGKNIYKNIRKSYNHISTDGKKMALTLYTTKNPPSKRLLYKIWELYFTRNLAWNNKKESTLQSIICRTRAFLNATIGTQTKSILQHQESELYVFTIDGKLAAFMHCYTHGNHVLMPKLAIDITYSRYSPGIIMLQESLKELMSRGFIDFDMCRGDERYKTEVGGIIEPIGTYNGYL